MNNKSPEVCKARPTDRARAHLGPPVQGPLLSLGVASGNALDFSGPWLLYQSCFVNSNQELDLINNVQAYLAAEPLSSSLYVYI